AKHHCLVLLGSFRLVALILLIVIPIGVGGLIDAKEEAFNKMKSTLEKKTDIKTQGLINDLTKQQQELGKQRGVLQDHMFKRQQGLISFPVELAHLNRLQFGDDKIKENGVDKEAISPNERGRYRDDAVYL